MAERVPGQGNRMLVLIVLVVAAYVGFAVWMQLNIPVNPEPVRVRP